jgi:hypothetical protein
VAPVELGPVTSHVVRTVGETVERMKPKNPHKISFEVFDRDRAPVFSPSDENIFAGMAQAVFGRNEQAEVDELRRLRSALYADKER